MNIYSERIKNSETQGSGQSTRLWVGIFIILRLAVSLIFSSDYSSQIFVPFTQKFLDGVGNPWNYFWANDLSVAFPYPPLMLYLLVPSVYLTSLFPSPSILQGMLLCLPTLLFDLLLLRTIKKLVPNLHYYHLVIWGVSPIVLFSCYAHGQLDLIPTSLLLASVYYLSRGRWLQSALLYGLSLSTKFHTILALPFFLIFIYKRYGLSVKNAPQYLTFILFPIGLYLFFAWPYLMSEGYQMFVHNNPEQTLVFEAFQRIGNLKILLAPTAIGLILGRFLVYPRINTDLLLGYLALAFSVFVFFVRPTPGWYVWGYPFVTILIFKYLPRMRYAGGMILLWNIAYIIYFVLFYQHPFNNLATLKILGNLFHSPFVTIILAKDLAFTFLEISTAIIIYNIYQHGILKNTIARLKAKAFTVGIGGDSGSGKSTLINDLKSLFGKNNFVMLEGDGDHKWERGDKNWENLTHLNPKANFLHRQAHQLEDLKKGLTTLRSDYDHNTGRFTQLKTVRPAFFVALSGLHAFYLPRLRKALDLKIFLAPSDDLRLQWKIERDSSERGHSVDLIKKQLEKRREDSQRHIEPQRQFADLVFSIRSRNELQIDCDPGIDLDFFEDQIIKNLSNKLLVKRDYSTDLAKQVVEIEGDITVEELKYLANELAPHRDDFLTQELIFKPGLSGLMQLFVLLAMSEKMREV